MQDSVRNRVELSQNALSILLTASRIGGDLYAHRYNPYTECFLSSVLDALKVSGRADQVQFSLDCYMDALVPVTRCFEKGQRHIQSIVLNPFWWKHKHIDLTMMSESNDLGSCPILNDFSQLVRGNQNLRQLHLASVNFIAHSSPEVMPGPHRVLSASTVLKRFGNDVSASCIDSLSLDGPFQFDASTWLAWVPCFNRLRSLTLSGALIGKMSEIGFITGESWLGNLEELRLSFPFWDRISPLDTGTTIFGLTLFNKISPTSRLRHLSLCGKSKGILHGSIGRWRETLRSLRFHFTGGIYVHPVNCKILVDINNAAPNLEWLGIDLPPWFVTGSDDELSAVCTAEKEEEREIATAVRNSFSPQLDRRISAGELHDLFRELAGFLHMKELSPFIEGSQGTTFNIWTFHVVHTFQALRILKAGVPLEKMTITCMNHIWAIQNLGRSRALLRSFSRESPEAGYTEELWDVEEMAMIKREKQVMGLPPEYEFGLSRWDIKAMKPAHC